jgi:hypothetical protein
MEHLFLFRRQAHELKMRQLVEEITLGRHTIESAMAKYQVLTRKTVTQWLERVRLEELARTQAMKESAPKPASTLVERVAQTADTLAGRVKQLEKELEQAELQVLYYKTVIRVAEQELGVSLEKKSVTK